MVRWKNLDFLFKFKFKTRKWLISDTKAFSEVFNPKLNIFSVHSCCWGGSCHLQQHEAVHQVTTFPPPPLTPTPRPLCTPPPPPLRYRTPDYNQSTPTCVFVWPSFLQLVLVYTRTLPRGVWSAAYRPNGSLNSAPTQQSTHSHPFPWVKYEQKSS